MSALKHSGLTSATRCCPLTRLPVELSLKVLMLIEIEAEVFTNLLLGDRVFYSFIKLHETKIVTNVVQHQDPLAARLLLRAIPSFSAFSRFYKEDKIFHSIVDNRPFANVKYYNHPDIKDPNFGQSPGFRHILRAGFLLHHQVVLIETRRGKAMYGERLPHEFWALFRVFSQFLSSVLLIKAACIFPDMKLYDSKLKSIVHLIAELAMFSGLKVVTDFSDIYDLHDKPVMIQETKDLYQWANSYESRYLANGDTVLLTDSKWPVNRLKLSSHLSFNIGSMSDTYFGASSKTSIRIDGTELSGHGEHLYDDILTLTGILPADQDEWALSAILGQIPVDQTRYHVTEIGEMDIRWDNY